MKRKIISAVLLAMSLTSSSVLAMKPVTIENQGSFMAGGKVVQSAGVYDGSDPRNLSRETLHGDLSQVNCTCKIAVALHTGCVD